MTPRRHARTAPRPTRRTCPRIARTTARARIRWTRGWGWSAAASGATRPTDATAPEPLPERMEPNPREVANRLLLRREFKPATSLNVLAGCWIQFQNHDWFGHGENAPDTYIDIELDENDEWPEGTPMRLRATSPDRTATGTSGLPPTYVNTVTHWWDLSQLYGSTEERNRELRSGTDGKLELVDGHAPQRDRPEARRRGPHGLFRQLLGRARAPAHALRQGAQLDLRPPQGLLSDLGRRAPVPDRPPGQLGAEREDPHRRVDARDPRQPGARARDARQLVRGPAALGAPEVRRTSGPR